MDISTRIWPQSINTGSEVWRGRPGFHAALLVKIVLAATVVSHIVSAPALGQSRSVMQDPGRGVTFQSIEFSDDRISDLTVIDGEFSDSDRLAIGFSAAILDGAADPYRYVIWIRHEGRRWLDTEAITPLELLVDGELVPLEYLRAPQPFVGANGLFYELIEREISPMHFHLFAGASEAIVRFSANSGHVEKVFLPEELSLIAEFRVSM
jgi:hypothetical protein